MCVRGREEVEGRVDDIIVGDRFKPALTWYDLASNFASATSLVRQEKKKKKKKDKRGGECRD